MSGREREGAFPGGPTHDTQHARTWVARGKERGELGFTFACLVSPITPHRTPHLLGALLALSPSPTHTHSLSLSLSLSLPTRTSSARSLLSRTAASAASLAMSVAASSSASLTARIANATSASARRRCSSSRRSCGAAGKGGWRGRGVAGEGGRLMCLDGAEFPRPGRPNRT